MSMYHLHACSQKKASEPLVLELQTVMSHHVYELGIKPRPSGEQLVLLTTEPSPAPRLTEVPAAVHDLPTFPTALCSRLAPEVSSHKDISRLASVA